MAAQEGRPAEVERDEKGFDPGMREGLCHFHSIRLQEQDIGICCLFFRVFLAGLGACM